MSEPASERIRGWRPDALEDIEATLLLDGIHRHYGYDFREYSPASLRRRLRKRMEEEELATLSQLQDRVLHDSDAMGRLLADLSINVTAMFRDPGFYAAFREHVVPLLRTYPFFRIWHAGCSTGEEAYSMAILLHEAGLLDRARIYATDMNEAVLEHARQGIYRLQHMEENERNYRAAGGTGSLEQYYLSGHGGALFHRWLTENVVFARHNLVTDGSFNEFHVILCRNVMIYFDQNLQNRVHGLLYESLARRGVLALGAKEHVRFTSHADDYEELDPRWKLFRRID